MGPFGFLPCALRLEHLALRLSLDARRTALAVPKPRSDWLVAFRSTPPRLARRLSLGALGTSLIALRTRREALALRSKHAGHQRSDQPRGLRSQRYAQLVREVYLMRGRARGASTRGT